ncbi:MAG: HdeD family acid-resistance protein, partial [Actinobacteria bacterium]
MSERSEDLHAMTKAWWVVALIGVMSIVAGIIVVAKPSNSLATLAVVTGIFVLVDGIVAIVRAFGPDIGSRGLAAVLGVVSI